MANPEALPGPKRRRERPLLVWAAPALIRRDGAVLLRKRDDDELFAGLWDLPSAPVVAGDVRAALQRALSGCGIACVPALEPAGEVRQVLTHREVRVLLFRGRQRGPLRAGAGVRWARSADVESLGISSLARKCLRVAALAANRTGRYKQPETVRAVEPGESK
jgi:adenine-specific DNA glycosylase